MDLSIWTKWVVLPELLDPLGRKVGKGRTAVAELSFIDRATAKTCRVNPLGQVNSRILANIWEAAS